MSSTRKPISRENRADIAKYLESQRGRPQAKPVRSAGVAASKVMRPLSKKFGSGASALNEHWSQIVGQRWAKISKPERFTGGRDGRTLIIRAPGAAASLIMASSGPIIDRLNGFLGESSVARIRVVQGQIKTEAYTPPPLPHRGLTPTEENTLQSGLADMPEDSLKQALKKLGRGVLASR